MSLSNKGTVNNTDGPSGHNHSLNNLFDVEPDSAVNGEILRSQNGYWVPKQALQTPAGINFTNATVTSGGSSVQTEIGSLTVNLEYPSYTLINFAAEISVPSGQTTGTALRTNISGTSIADIKAGGLFTNVNYGGTPPASFNNYITYVADNNFVENQLVTISGTSNSTYFDSTSGKPGLVVNTDTYPLSDTQFTVLMYKNPPLTNQTIPTDGGTATAVSWVGINDSNNVAISSAADAGIDANGDSLVTFTTSASHNLSVGQSIVIETTGTANAWTNAVPQKVISIPWDSSTGSASTTQFKVINSGGTGSSITNTNVNFGSPLNFNPAQFISVTQSETGVTGSHQRTGYLIKYLPKGKTKITLNSYTTFTVGTVSFNNASMHVIPLG